MSFIDPVTGHIIHGGQQPNYASDPIVPKESFRDDMWGQQDPMNHATANVSDGNFLPPDADAINAANEAQARNLESIYVGGTPVDMAAASSNMPYERSASEYGTDNPTEGNGPTGTDLRVEGQVADETHNAFNADSHAKVFADIRDRLETLRRGL